MRVYKGCIDTTMAVEFTNEHVVGVTAFVLALCFCRSIVDCIQMFIVFSSECKNCPLACNHDCRVNTAFYSKFFLISFNMTQPLIMCFAAPLKEFFSGVRPTSHVGFVHVHTVQLANSSSTGDPPDSLVATESFIDMLFVVTPFSLMACLSTFVWFNLGKAGVLNSDTVWDCELLAENEDVWLYEALYFCEILGMSFALISISSLPQTAAETLYMSCTITALMIFFFSASRFENHSRTGICMSYTAFSLLVAMTSSYVSTSVDTACPFAVLSASVLVIAVLALAIFHFIACGSFTAGSIVLFRTIVSNACSIALIATLTAGRTSACAHRAVF